MAQTNYTPIQLYYSTTASAVPVNTNLANGELAINILDGKLFYKNSSNVVKVMMTNPAGLNYPTADGTSGQAITTNGSGVLSFTTINSLPSQATHAGQYLTTDGTTASWASITAGAALSNDTSTSSNLYPMFAAATSGTPTTVYTSNAKLLYKPSTGEFQASELVASNGLVVNSSTVSASYTVASGYNAMSVGPITVASGQSVTVTSGQRWVVL